MTDGRFLYGAAYYPEHWDRSLWDEDARLMREAGFNTVRLAEFAWVYMEPKEGVFDFAWLDEAIELLGNHGIRTILGTPTATIPAWMARTYPEVMAADVDGHRRLFSIRKDYCVNHPEFDRLSMRIVEKMAEHFAGNPNVVGFQTDNEYLGSSCRCSLCLSLFRRFLEERYGTIEKLNEEWGTWFWGTAYGSFEEVGWPAGAPNPSHALDASRFSCEVDVRHNAKQVEILKRLAPGKALTHNTHNFFGDMNVDFRQIVSEMDFASWDSYPRTDTGDRFHHEIWANAVVWALKRRNFVVMEQQSGAGGWFEYGPGVAPGEMSMLAWQSVARGADGILFFRWRTSVSGQEQYWHGILNHDNVPRRRYREVVELGASFKKVEPLLLGTEPLRGIGVYFSYEEVWAARCQMQNREGAVHPRDVSLDLFSAIGSLGLDAGVFFEPEALYEYKTVVLPVAQLSNRPLVTALEDWVAAGGTLVLLPRSGDKTENHKMLMGPCPGPFRRLAGVEVEEYAAIPASADWSLELGSSQIGVSRVREHLTAHGASIVGVHRGGFMDGWAGASRYQFGNGTVWYLGGFPTAAGWASLLPLIDPVVSQFVLPSGVEIARRAGHGRVLMFLLNHTDQPVEVGCNGSSLEAVLGDIRDYIVPLGPFGVAILQVPA